jgi:hypothetical protein
MVGSTSQRAGAIRAKNDKTEIISGPESGTWEELRPPTELDQFDRWNTSAGGRGVLMTPGRYRY